MFRILFFLVVLGLLVWLAILFLKLKELYLKKSQPVTIADKIQSSINRCLMALNQNRLEINDIESNIEEINQELSDASSLSPKNMEKSKQVLEGFTKEKDLRLAKSEFYQTAIKKLNLLLKNHQWAEGLEEKKNTLEGLRQHHYDDLATMEEIKYSVHAEEEYVHTIDSLSLKILDSTSLDDTKLVKEELEKIIEEL
jgi:predicted  nucleic acid-binding Zn-ribbon protein